MVIKSYLKIFELSIMHYKTLKALRKFMTIFDLQFLKGFW